MIVIGIIIIVLAAVVYGFMQQDVFGNKPTAERLERMKRSPNFKDGQFQNQHHTPALTEGYGYTEVMIEFFFKKVDGRIPAVEIPSQKTNLHSLPKDQNILVWFGHSSYYMHLDGKRFLVDPVFSGNASPLPGSNKAFKGTDRYTVNDLPAIDYLFITHDHYDHADYETLLKLNAKTGKVITGLGVGAHLELWGFHADKITETDWNETVTLDSGFLVHTLPARHFSGRGFKRNGTLWVSFLLQSPTKKIYIGGDSGYDTHFAEIGKAHAPIDLALLENGQYDIKWKYIHMLPEEVLKAGKDLGAKRVMPVHSGKFAMANHSWDDPLKQVTEFNQSYQLHLITPMIGEPVLLDSEQQVFSQWWTTVNKQ